MPYNDTIVILGGIVHIPVIIIVLKFVDDIFNKTQVDYQEK